MEAQEKEVAVTNISWDSGKGKALCYSRSREGFTGAAKAIHRVITRTANLGQLLAEDGCVATIEADEFYAYPSEEEVAHEIAIQLEQSRAGKHFASLTCSTPGTRH
jgi:hypothetical protein